MTWCMDRWEEARDDRRMTRAIDRSFDDDLKANKEEKESEK